MTEESRLGEISKSGENAVPWVFATDNVFGWGPQDDVQSMWRFICEGMRSEE